MSYPNPAKATNVPRKTDKTGIIYPEIPDSDLSGNTSMFPAAS